MKGKNFDTRYNITIIWKMMFYESWNTHNTVIYNIFDVQNDETG